MQLGLGVLGWSPDVFWRSNVTELYRALEGWKEVNSAPDPADDAMTPEEYKALREKLAAQRAKKCQQK
jgi:hypothetical protein